MAIEREQVVKESAPGAAESRDQERAPDRNLGDLGMGRDIAGHAEVGQDADKQFALQATQRRLVVTARDLKRRGQTAQSIDVYILRRVRRGANLSRGDAPKVIDIDDASCWHCRETQRFPRSTGLAAALEVQGEATRADKGIQDPAGAGAVLNRRFGQSSGAVQKRI
ncbi:hypothetical protein [Bradyrhizobium sp.]|uniref:hypothetical protein n=1 Tax=Bradyrhizobium sp. TaxID=376 RepID=UPI003C1CCCCA